VLAKEKYGIRERDVAKAGRNVRGVHGADAHERREHERSPGPKGRADAVEAT